MLKKNKGEAYIDTIITVFLALVVVSVSISLFSTMYEYQKINDIADVVVEYASVEGNINSEYLNKKIDKIIKANGYDNESLSFTFENSDIINDGSEIQKVQYGNNISFSISYSKSIGFIGEDGIISVPISITKNATSQKYWK